VDVAIVSSVAFVVAAITLISGFGLGTVLTPTLAVFLPVSAAVAGSAVVHLANNLFKIGLVGRHADRTVVVRFGVPAVAAAVGGASLLSILDRLPRLLTYQVGPVTAQVTPIKLVIGILIVVFALLELGRGPRGPQLSRRWLPAGGLLSGFFGGLSGNQGALRSAFLTRAGLDRDAFVGTGVLTAVIVDVTRLAVYGLTFDIGSLAGSGAGPLLVAATAAAFAGSFAGSRLLRRVTLGTVQRIVAILLVFVGAGLAAGLL